jgi:hypothetical protein
MEALKWGLGVIFLVIAVVLAVGFLTTNAPTIATQTSTAAGSALANAGITSTTTAGQIYGFTNVFYALAALLAVAVGLVYKMIKE